MIFDNTIKLADIAIVIATLMGPVLASAGVGVRELMLKFLNGENAISVKTSPA